MRFSMCSCGQLRTKVKELISSQLIVGDLLIFWKMSSGRNWQPELKMQFSFLKMLGMGGQEALCRSSRWFLLYMEKIQWKKHQSWQMRLSLIQQLMIKGKKIQAGSIKVVVTARSGLKNRVGEVAELPTSSELISSSTEIQEHHDKEHVHVRKHHIQRQNSSKKANQPTPNKETVKPPLNRSEGLLNNKSNAKLPKPQDKNTVKQPQKIAKEVVTNQKSKPKQQKATTKVNTTNAKKQTKLPIKVPSKQPDQRQTAGSSLVQQVAFSQQQDQIEEQQRQCLPNPIESQQQDELLLSIMHDITIKDLSSQEQSQPQFNYSFFPQSQPICQEMEQLELNMDLFEMTSDQLLALDYFTI